MKEDSFPNLAGEPDIDDEVIAELEAAGLEYTQAKWILNSSGEVKTSVLGGYKGWGFRRLWYYWSASGPGIPPSYANKLYETNKKDVRVAGHCGCPSPLEWYNGFAVGSYHIDSPSGLKALADTLKLIIKEATDDTD